MISEELQSLGLSKGESRAYTSLLKLKSSTVGPIVKESKIAYSKIYDVLNRLVEKGLVTYIIKDNKRYFHALPPNRLMDYLNNKQKEIEKNKSKLNDLLPQILSLNSSSANEAQIFLGKNGILSGYEKFLENMEEHEEINFFYSYNEEYHDKARKFYNEIPKFKELLKNSNKLKKIKWRGISNRINKEDLLPSMQYRIAPFPVPGNIDINNKCVFLTIWSDNPVGILINSNEAATNFQDYFKVIWNLSKDIK